MTRRLRLRLAVAALAPALLVGAPAASAAAPAPAPVVRMDHISITAMGKDDPVILIPGLASPRAVWDGIAPELARTHHVILVQVNGFGGDDPGANLQPGVLNGVVRDLDAYLTAHKLTGAPVIGHSLGGLVGMMLAKAHPADVGKLMIVDSLPYFAVLMAPPGVDPTPAMVEPQAKAMRDAIAASYGKPADAAAITAQANRLARKPASVEKLKTWMASADPRVTAEALYEDLTTDLRPDLGSIATPITLVYPWNADGPTKAMADPFYRKQYAAAPHITYVDVGDSAHFIMLDQPEKFAAAVAAFLGS